MCDRDRVVEGVSCAGPIAPGDLARASPATGVMQWRARPELFKDDDVGGDGSLGAAEVGG
jgi:hypothetical protein